MLGGQSWRGQDFVYLLATVNPSMYPKDMPKTQGAKTPRKVTMNQVVAMNLRRARLLRGWSLAEAGEALKDYLGAPWSKQGFSNAENATAAKVRNFSANEVVAFSLGFELPLLYFLLPPVEEDVEVVPAMGSKVALSHRSLWNLLIGTAGEDGVRLTDRIQAVFNALGGSKLQGELDDRIIAILRASIEGTVAKELGDARDVVATLREAADGLERTATALERGAEEGFQNARNMIRELRHAEGDVR